LPFIVTAKKQGSFFRRGLGTVSDVGKTLILTQRLSGATADENQETVSALTRVEVIIGRARAIVSETPLQGQWLEPL
jgi:hypothetical protein